METHFANLWRTRMTREEREKAYNEARERIFGTTETSTPGMQKLSQRAYNGTDHPLDNDDSTGMSRASSVSLRDKANGGKRMRRRRDSDTFETRSNYVAYAPAYGHSHQPTWVQPQYISASTQFSSPTQQQQYPPPMPGMYGPPNQAYAPMMPGGAYAPQQYNNMPNVSHAQVAIGVNISLTPQQYSQPPGQPRYQPPMAPVAPGPYGSPMQPPPPQPHGWQQQPPPPPPPPPSFNQSPYQSRATPAAPAGGIPYAYGALPVNVNPHDPKSQHPIPGSFNRHAFNPKTQSFVPGNGMAPMAPASGPYNAYMPPQQGSPQLAPPHMSYAGYQAGPPMGQPPYGSGGYNMLRQGSNNSLPPYHHPPATMQHPAHVPHQLPPHPNTQGPPHIPNKPSMPQGPPMVHGQTYNHLPNYGNPASLPQKPTT